MTKRKKEKPMRTTQEHGSQMAMLRRPIVVEETMAAGITRARVKCECRLEWYSFRALIDARQLAAGLRFRLDWMSAGIEQRQISSYAQTIAGSGEISDQRLSARRRLLSAYRSLRGSGEQAVIVAVCGMDEWAHQGTGTLREALNGLAKHYGLT